MAETPEVELIFQAGCPDCGMRRAHLPAPLPPVGDDFDWRLRDYDGFRLFMLEELAARFPERQRWTPADLEVVLVEALSAVLTCSTGWPTRPIWLPPAAPSRCAACCP